MAEQKLPTAIQRQMEHAAQVEAEIIKAQEQQNAAPQETQGTPPEAPEQDNPPTETTHETPTDVPEGEPSSEDADLDAAPAPTEKEAALEQKLRTLQGKYSNEVPALTEQVREEARKREALEAQIAALNEAKKKEPEPKREALVTSKDEEEYGKDMLDFVSRAIKDETFRPLSEITRSLRALETVVKNLQALPNQVNAVNARVEQTHQQNFWQKLESLVPNWQTIDEDPTWIEFLDTKPPFSINSTYRDLANDAINGMKPEAIRDMVEQWKLETGQTKKQAKAAKSQKNLASRVTPEKASTSSPPPAEPQMWSQQDYNDAFDPRKMKGKSEKEIADIQAAADLALMEGRIKP